MRRLAAFFLTLASLALPALSLAQTATLDGVSFTLQTVATGLDSPVYLTSPPGDPRLFVL